MIAEISQGKLEGFAKDGVLRFNGIPYAKPPIDALRWRPAEAPEPWAGVRDVSRFGNIAPQVSSAAEALIGGTPGEQSEDCLYLNVVTPSLDGKRPVMVYIHGGAYANGSGSSPLYDGGRLARRGDVVVVTLNHRLNIFGYLYLKFLPRKGLTFAATERYFSARNEYYRWKRRRAARKFEVYMRKHNRDVHFDREGRYVDPDEGKNPNDRKWMN